MLNFILVKTPLKHGGIALASSIAFSVSCVFLFYFLLKELDYQIKIRTILQDFIKTGLICLIVGIIIYYLFHKFIYLFLSKLISSLFLQNLLSLIIVTLIAFILYVGFISIFGPTEIKSRIKKILIQ